MMLNSSGSEELWDSCFLILKSIEADKLRESLSQLICFVKKNEALFRDYADLNFLQYVLNMEVNDYILGTCGDDFESLGDYYALEKYPSIGRVWEIASTLLWDLTTYTTNDICPHCKSDHLRIVTDLYCYNIFQECETCFYISENGQIVKRPKELFPATKEQIKKLLDKSYLG